MWKKVGSVHSSQKQEVSSFQSKELASPFLRKDCGQKRKANFSAMINEQMQNPLSGKTTVKQSRSKSINPRKLAIGYRTSDSNMMMTQIHINFHSQQKPSKEPSLHFENAAEPKVNIPIQKWRETVLKAREIKASQAELKEYVRVEMNGLGQIFRQTFKKITKMKSKKTLKVLQQMKEFKVRMEEYEEERERILRSHDLTLDSLL